MSADQAAECFGLGAIAPCLTDSCPPAAAKPIRVSPMLSQLPSAQPCTIISNDGEFQITTLLCVVRAIHS